MTYAPWAVSSTDWRIIEDSHGRVVADVRVPPQDGGADVAILLAAAPDLYAALKQVTDELGAWAGVDTLLPDSGTRIIYERGRAALAKVRP